MTELCDQNATDLRRMIGSKEISPVELLDSCINRVEAVNPTLNVVVSECYERAREEAKAAEKDVIGGEQLDCCMVCRSGSKIWKRPRVLGRHTVPSFMKITCLIRTKSLFAMCVTKAASYFVKPTRQNLVQARIRAILYLGQQEIHLIQ